MNMLRMVRIAVGSEKTQADLKKARKGYSLAELILGAAVIAAFLVRIYQAYAATSAADKFQDYTSEIGLINGTVHQDFINTSSFDGLDENSVVGSLPRKYQTGTAAPYGINSVYQNPVFLAADPGVAGVANSSFTVTSTVPTSDCVKALLGDMGRNLDSISVVDGVAAAASAANEAVNVPFTGATASTMCANATSDNATITYLFH